jgi:hypothetical protein
MGVSFKRCVTLGRQHYFPSRSETFKLFRDFGVDPRNCAKLYLTDQSARYAEPFWEALGVEHLETIDASGFEGATIVHDMNQPIPDNLKSQFDAVVDAGTLEHIFNFPQAIRNCMDMVKTGGHLITHTTANNCFGHGFYQFSPELFFRIFSGKNGFQVDRMVAIEYGPRRRWYEVIDPEVIRARGTLINSFQVLLLIQAKRIETVPIFSESPQQSDYFARWTDYANEPENGRARSRVTARERWIRRLKTSLLEGTPRLARMLEALTTSSLNKNYSFRNRISFKRIRK